jgi:hypothetical protein
VDEDETDHFLMESKRSDIENADLRRNRAGVVGAVWASDRFGMGNGEGPLGNVRHGVAPAMVEIRGLMSRYEIDNAGPKPIRRIQRFRSVPL